MTEDMQAKAEEEMKKFADIVAHYYVNEVLPDLIAFGQSTVKVEFTDEGLAFERVGLKAETIN